MNTMWNNIKFILCGEGLILGLAILWYDDIRWILPLQSLLLPYRYILHRSRKKKNSVEYEKGFYDFLQSLLPSLQAGYSLESACDSAYRELKDLYGGEHAFVKEMTQLIYGLEVHIPVDELFLEMGDRTESQDIHQFAVVLEILKNMGGNSVEILRNSMIRIQKKMETAEEIRTLLSGKVYEKNLMLMMPFLMILYLRITNSAYLDTLYHTVIGQGLMTISLGIVIGCYFWSEHIMTIRF